MTNKEAFARAFLSSDGNIETKIAQGMKKAAEEIDINIDPAEWFCGNATNSLGVFYAFGGGIVVNKESIEDTDIYEKIAPYATAMLIEKTKSEEYKAAETDKACWGGGWGGHSNPDYASLLHLGTDGLRARIEKYRKINTGKDEFYTSLETALEALDILGSRYGKLAEKMAETAEGEEKKILLRLADTFKVIPQKPPYDFFSACEYFWFYFMFDGNDSPGRFDQYMIDYFRMSEKEDALICLDKLWELFHKNRSWNLCVGGSTARGSTAGGSTADGENEYNELTDAILDAAEKYKWNTPNLTMRMNSNTPDRLWKRAAEVIGTGIGMPALYNDDVVCPALEELGIPAEDAHEYCMNGCNQIDIMGKSHMGLEDGEVSLIKCLELALFDGVSQTSGKKIGTSTGREFSDFDSVMDAYKKQVEYITDLAVSAANNSQRVYAEHAPNPLRSNLIMGCVEKGRDYKAGGPLYNHGQVLIEGLSDAADSLAAIKHFVYDTKEMTIEELLSALEKDFDGLEGLRKKLVNFKKFGNDDDYTDRIAAEIFRHFSEYLMTKQTFRGGIYGSGLSTFNRTASYGQKTGANANGRKNGELLLADSLGAEPGADKKGPTAALRSAMKYDQKLAKSGLVLNIKFQKEMFRSNKGIESFVTLAKTYFAGGGQQLSVNVVSAEELMAAKKNPEKYGSLIVRVGGYSEVFVKLPPELQDNIIARTAFEL